MLFPFLSDHGVLGLNARNLLYIKPFNPRKAVAFADDKLKTKSFLSARGIPTAKVHAEIRSRRQLKNFDFKSLPDECVLKPNFGYGGEGILILKGRKNGEFLLQGKTPIGTQEMSEHIEDILDGKFSVNGLPDAAFFEQILYPHKSMLPFRPAGLPDIRIVVFNLVPVMAMLRIPTAESEGKANVHLGGIGIGIDLSKGVTTYAAQYHKILQEMPSGMPIAGTEIPYWQEMLLISSRIQYITNIGYLAVDLTLDKEMGPVLLEVNARAGLMVQVANLAPLRSRLRRVEGLDVTSPEKGVRLAQELFGQKLQRQESELLPKRPVLGMREVIEIGGKGLTLEELANIAPEQEYTTFSSDLVEELLRRGALEKVSENQLGGTENSYRVKFSLGGEKMQTIIHSGKTPHDVRAVIGQRDLKKFLIDPARSTKAHVQMSNVRKDLRAIDRVLADIDRKLQVLRYLRPLNLEEERKRMRLDDHYNPVFLQRDIPFSLDEIESALREIEAEDTPLGIILKKKKRELLLKVDLLRSRGSSVALTTSSIALYGAPTPSLMGFAEAHLLSRKACELRPADSRLLTAEQVKKRFEQILLAYGLHDWQVALRTSMVADCAVGSKNIYVRKAATFTETHIASLIAHEIEVHVLTAENGAAQPYQIFRRGFGNYLDTQEGLAVFSQIRVLPEDHDKRYIHAIRVLGVSYALEHSLADLRRYLRDTLGLQDEKAIGAAIDMKRGIIRSEEPGTFTRGLSYFRGYRAIEHFVREGGDLRKLYVGKIAIEDLPLIEKMPEVKAALILPVHLRPKPMVKKGKSKIVTVH